MLMIPPQVDVKKLHLVGNHQLLLTRSLINRVRKIFQELNTLKILRQTHHRDVKKSEKLTDIEHNLSLPYNVYRDENNKLYAMYQREELLGKGGCARVKLAQDLDTGKWAAVKIYKFPLKKAHSEKEKIEKEIQFEMAAGLYLGRTFFKRKVDIKYYVFKKYIFGKLLSELIKQQALIGFLEKHSIATQLIQETLELHAKGFIHGDIKPKNIIFDHATNKLKLIDFGISEKSENKAKLMAPVKKKMGTNKFMAPEYVAGEKIRDQKIYVMTDKTDAYAIGVTLAKLFKKTSMPEKSKIIIEELIASLCHVNPLQRVSVYQAGLILKNLNTHH